MTTIDRLTALLDLLDQERRHLDKTPFQADPDQVDAAAQLVLAARHLLDDVCDALAPHVRHLDPRHQATVTGGWVFYDEHRATTWPPPHRPLLIRAHEADGPRTGARVAVRRGMYEGGRLCWAPYGHPVPPSYHYSWREAT